jgi:low temperature requirement protein LtrA
VAAEETMSTADETRRLTIALEGYTYGHFGLVAGILLAASGVEMALEHQTDGDAIGLFAAVMLLGGLAFHLGGHVWFKARVFHSVNAGRVAAAIALVVAIPVVQRLHAIGALAVPTAILATLVALESRHHADLRQRLHDP